MKDVKYALRLFWKSPGFTAVVLLTLALGIGANTAVFSLIDGVLLRPLPYHDPDRLVDILDTSVRERGLARIFASYADFDEFTKHATTVDHLAAATWAGRMSAVLTGHGPAKSYLTIPVTATFFETLGVAAQLGRTFTAADMHGGCSVVLSDKFWRGPLGGDARVAGRTLTLDDRACTVAGVMPPTFSFYPPEAKIWTLLPPDDPRLKKYFGVFMVARLRRGITAAQARSELQALHTALHATESNGENDFTPLVSGLQDQFVWLAGRTLRTTLGALFLSVMAVLAIACLNVANLLLGRSFGRGREFAIRAALGSGRARLLRQALVESSMLSCAGGALGLLAAFGAVRYFIHIQPIELPVGSSISINLPALRFTIAVSIVTAVVFALVPAWVLSQGDPYDALRGSGSTATPGRQRLSRFFVAAEMALSVILLAGAGLLMRSAIGFESAPLGFRVDGVLTTSGTLPQPRYRDVSRRVAFFDELQRRLQNLPGIGSAAAASTLPPYGLGLNTIEIQDQPVAPAARKHDVGQAAVGADYFRVFDIPLRRGRTFRLDDQAETEPVAVVNEALAREYFGGRDPIGQRIRVGDERDWLTIVGVAGNERRPEVLREMVWLERPAVYRPLNQNAPDHFSIALRGRETQAGIGHAVEQVVAAIDADVAVGDVESLRSSLAPYVKNPRFRAAVLSAFAALAILLAAVGLYGVLAQFVAQRTCEIGVRMAVGAGRKDIVGLVASKGGAPVLGGLLFGLLSAFALTRYLESFLYDVRAADPLTFAAAVCVMVIAASIAMILPAWRAARVDPVVALRSD